MAPLGTVTFNSVGRTQKLRLTTRAGMALEERCGASIMGLLGDGANTVSFRFAVAFFACCLEDGAGVSDDQAADVIDGLGGLKPAADKIGETVAKAFPDDSDGKAAGAGKEAGPTGNAKGKAG